MSLLAETRGYSNNNPGNIIKTSTEWLGKVECSDKKFECFDTMEKGVRALVLVLNSYYIKHGLRYNDEIISRYVGKGDKNKSSYLFYSMERSPIVCGSKYTTVVANLVKVIVYFENGYLKKGLSINKVVEATLKKGVGDKWVCYEEV